MRIASNENDMFTLCFNNYERLRLREALTSVLMYYENMGNESVVSTATELLSDHFLPEQGMSNLTPSQYSVLMSAVRHELESADSAYDRTEYQKYAENLNENYL